MRLFNNRKAQGLPITTIIIAVLAILVLIVLFAIFTGRITLFGRALSACPGECISPVPESQLQQFSPIDNPCTDPIKQKQLPGVYARSGQDLSQPRDKLLFCIACCISVE